MFEKIKKASKKKFFWTWFLLISAFLITLVALTISTIIRNILLISIVSGVALVLGFGLDIILLIKKKK